MHERRQFWARAITKGWQEVVSLKDHLEVALILIVALLITVGVTLRFGGQWYAVGLALVVMLVIVLDGAYLVWHESAPSDQIEVTRVPPNADDLVRAIMGTRNAAWDLLRATRNFFADPSAALGEGMQNEGRKVEDAVRELELQEKRAGPDYETFITLFRLTVRDEISSVMEQRPKTEDEIHAYRVRIGEQADTLIKRVYSGGLYLGDLFRSQQSAPDTAGSESE